MPGRVGLQRADGRAPARTQRLAAGGRSRGHADAPPPRHVRQRLCGELCRWVFVEGLLLEITSAWVTDFRPPGSHRQRAPSLQSRSSWRSLTKEETGTGGRRRVFGCARACWSGIIRGGNSTEDENLTGAG